MEELNDFVQEKFGYSGYLYPLYPL